MKITWDEIKREANLTKHGLDFRFLNLDFLETALVLEAHSNRYKAIFKSNDKAYVAIFSLLGNEAISLISYRVASKKERTIL